MLDTFGCHLSDSGDAGRAKDLLERSVALRPKEGHEKFLHLAQLAEGDEALEHYERGSEVLAAAAEAASKREGAGADAEARSLRRQLACARAAIAELYMTDLCDLPEAEERCEAALESGRAADAECLELLSTTAMLRKVQGRLDDAKSLALGCAARVRKAKEAEGSPDAEKAATLSDDAVTSLCRTLIDLSETEEARTLLTGLLEEDEEDIQVWQLLTYCHLVEEDKEGTLECARHALKLCARQGEEGKMWAPGIRDLLRQAKALRVESRPAASRASSGSALDK